MSPAIASYLAEVSDHFDRNPRPVPVLRVDDTVGGGFAAVGDLTLTIVPGPTSAARPLALPLGDGATLADVVTAVERAGYTTSTLDPNLTAVSAAALADQRGPFSGTLYLGLATNPLWAILQTIALGAHRQDGRLGGATAQLDLRLASDRWLDHAALVYGVRRAAGESDDRLRRRAIFHGGRPKATTASLAEAASRICGVPVEVRDGARWTWTAGLRRSVATTRITGWRSRTLPGNVPTITVTPTRLMAADRTPLVNESGENRWLRTAGGGLPGTPVGGNPDPQAVTIVAPSTDAFYRPFADRQLARLSPQAASRDLWAILDQYKAAGVAVLLDLPATRCYDAVAAAPLAPGSTAPIAVALAAMSTPLPLSDGELWQSPYALTEYWLED